MLMAILMLWVRWRGSLCGFSSSLFLRFRSFLKTHLLALYGGASSFTVKGSRYHGSLTAFQCICVTREIWGKACEMCEGEGRDSLLQNMFNIYLYS